MKHFVKLENNRCSSVHHNFIQVGDTVVVKDGSYMTSEDKKERVTGVQFIDGNGLYELLTVTRINIPFRTDYCVPSLGYHNNCEIQDGEGKKYYCSKINIVNFKTR